LAVPVRALVAIGSTTVGVALLVSFKTPDTPAARIPGSQAAAVTAPPTPPPDAGAGSAGQTPAPGSSTSSSSSSSSGGSGLRDGRFTGQDVPNQYGDVQVAVVVSGGRITDVVAMQLPNDRQRSAEISQVAGPMLHDEVLQAQSAQIDSISGATYTSESYAASAQSALDQAHG
jgi:uncharacterized protein with FMN-binding domain